MTETTAGTEPTLAQRLLRSAAHFSMGQVVSMGASIARVAVAAHALTAEANGTWLGLQLVLSYGGYLHLGSLFGLFRSLPLLRAQGEYDEAERERRTSFTFTLGVALCAAPVVYYIASHLFPAVPFSQIAAVAFLVGLALLRSYYATVLRAESRFAEQAAGVSVGAVVALATLPMISRWGLDGLLFSNAAQGIVEAAILAYRCGRPRFGWSTAVLWRQIRVGSITVLTSVASLMLTTIDRTVMIDRLGSDAAGAYYIGANIMILLPVIVGVPAAVLSPQFFARVGRGEDVTPLVARPVHLASLGVAALAGIGSVATPVIIQVLWPHLAGGTRAAQVALYGTFPLVLAGLMSNVYYAYDRQMLHVWILAACAGLSFALAHAGVSMTHSILGAAAGSALGLLAYFPAATIGAYWILGAPRQALVLVAKSLAPLVYAASISLATEWLLGLALPASLIARGLAGTVVVGVAMLPLILRARAVLRAGLGPSSSP